MAKHNTYSCSFFLYKERVLFLEYVDSINKAIEWIDSKNIQWHYINIYERKTRLFVSRLYNPNNQIKR